MGITKKMVPTNAMLDNCSQDSFILDSVVKKLGIHGTKVTLRCESTVSIEDIKVTGMHGDSSWLSIPKLYF